MSGIMTYCTLLLASALHAGEWHVEKNYGANLVSFTSEVIGFSFSGQTNGIDGYIYDKNSYFFTDDSDFFFEVDLSSLDTGIGKRDRDMREILNTRRWPKATFSGKLGAVVKDSSDQNVFLTRSRGVLNLRGVERTIVVDTKIRAEKEGFKISADFPIFLNDFNIEAPKLVAFLKVSEEIQITVSFTLVAISTETNATGEK